MANKLNTFLATLAVMNIKIHNMHWNVVGRNFIIIHKLTEELYQMCQKQFDEVAEALKMQNELPLARMEDYLQESVVDEIESRDYTEREILNELDADCAEIANLALEIRDKAEEEDNFLIANLLEDYIALYSKHSWMIRAMLQNKSQFYEESDYNDNEDMEEIDMKDTTKTTKTDKTAQENKSNKKSKTGKSKDTKSSK